MKDLIEKIDDNTVRVTKSVTETVSMEEINNRVITAQGHLDEFDARTAKQREVLQAAYDDAVSFSYAAAKAAPVIGR